MPDEIAIESLESEIQFDKMYKDVIIYLITESDESTDNASTSHTTSPNGRYHSFYN